MCSNQRGAVLIFAMVVLLLVASLTVTIASRFEMVVAAAGSRLHGEQAQLYLGGAESLGLAVLARDSRNGADSDHLVEDWARRIPEFPVDGGWVRASLEDAQGRLNINTLARKARNRAAVGGEAARFTPAQRRFIRLLQTFESPGLSQPEAIAIAEAVIDWLDSDDEVTGYGGAEKDYYLRLRQPYRPANGYLVDTSELRLVRGVTPELYQRLEYFIAALHPEAALNINTAPVPVLRTINRQDELLPLDIYAATSLARWREEYKAFDSLDSFLLQEQVLVLQAGKNGVVTEGLGVRSDLFLLRAETEVMGHYRSIVSLLQRNSAGGNVVRRWSPGESAAR